MKLGDIVRIKAIGSQPRDMMYAGFQGKVTQVSLTGCYVESDGAGLQAVSFKEWFHKSDLEVIT